MSVDRGISIRIVTNRERFSDLIIDFLKDFWTSEAPQISSLKKDDVDDHDFIDYPDLDSLKPVFDYREDKKQDNCLSIWVDDLQEGIAIIARKKEATYEGYNSHYELSFNPGVGKRIEHADRYTDYGFYLNQLIPRLLELDCYVCEVNCQDFDS